MILVGWLGVAFPKSLLMLDARALAVAVVVLALVGGTIAVLSNVNKRRRQASTPAATRVEAADDAPMTDSFLSRLDVAPADRMLPLGAAAYATLAVVLSLGLWVVGYALAPEKRTFLASREWQVQPLYLLAHLVTLRLFVAVFTRNWRQGLANVDADPAEARIGMRRIVGLRGLFAAVVVAVPFCLYELAWIGGDKYPRLSDSMVVAPIDWMLWGIWSFEWFLQAFIWVLVVGFLFINCRLIKKYEFKASIDRVIWEKLYRPFLRMSSQGASVVLGFGFITLFYIWYADGIATDWIGLAITTGLLLVGFFLPWQMLRHKVRRGVEAELAEMRRVLANTETSEPPQRSTAALRVATLAGLATLHRREGQANEREEPGSPAPLTVGGLHRRLDRIEAMQRITYLQGLKLALVRLAAPAATIGWHVSQSSVVGRATVAKVSKLIFGG
jgi:hypothetical protein